MGWISNMLKGKAPTDISIGGHMVCRGGDSNLIGRDLERAVKDVVWFAQGVQPIKITINKLGCRFTISRDSLRDVVVVVAAACVADWRAVAAAAIKRAAEEAVPISEDEAAQIAREFVDAPLPPAYEGTAPPAYEA